MLKRLKVWSYLAVAAGASMCAWGCSGGWFPWGAEVGSWTNVITAILREDLFG
jgi:hypothetical protein